MLALKLEVEARSGPAFGDDSRLRLFAMVIVSKTLALARLCGALRSRRSEKEGREGATYFLISLVGVIKLILAFGSRTPPHTPKSTNLSRALNTCSRTIHQQFST
jgi:hypothetical protein